MLMLVMISTSPVFAQHFSQTLGTCGCELHHHATVSYTTTALVLISVTAAIVLALIALLIEKSRQRAWCHLE